MSTSSPPGWRAYALVAMLAAALYSHPRMLDGEFVYDDGGTITGNPVTLGQVPWSQLWKRDYWGKDHIASRASPRTDLVRELLGSPPVHAAKVRKAAMAEANTTMGDLFGESSGDEEVVAPAAAVEFAAEATAVKIVQMLEAGEEL